MIAWWLSLTISQQVALALGMASTLVLVIDFVLFTINFYGIDRLNAEPENLYKYEIVANNDSDNSKNIPRLISIKSLNVFVAITSWLYFGLWSKLSQTWVIIIAIVVGLIVSFIDSLIERYVKTK